MGKPGEVHWEEWMSDVKRPLASASGSQPSDFSPPATTPTTAGTPIGDRAAETSEASGNTPATAVGPETADIITGRPISSDGTGDPANAVKAESS